MSRRRARSGRRPVSKPGSPQSPPPMRASRPSVGRLGDSRRADRLLHSPTVAAYSLTTEIEGGPNGQQGAETFDPRSQKAQTEKERRGKEIGPVANNPKLTSGLSARGRLDRSPSSRADAPRIFAGRACAARAGAGAIRRRAPTGWQRVRAPPRSPARPARPIESAGCCGRFRGCRRSPCGCAPAGSRSRARRGRRRPPFP